MASKEGARKGADGMAKERTWGYEARCLGCGMIFMPTGLSDEELEHYECEFRGKAGRIWRVGVVEGEGGELAMVRQEIGRGIRLKWKWDNIGLVIGLTMLMAGLALLATMKLGW